MKKENNRWFVLWH